MLYFAPQMAQFVHSLQLDGLRVSEESGPTTADFILRGHGRNAFIVWAVGHEMWQPGATIKRIKSLELPHPELNSELPPVYVLLTRNKGTAVKAFSERQVPLHCRYITDSSLSYPSIHFFTFPSARIKCGRVDREWCCFSNCRCRRARGASDEKHYPIESSTSLLFCTRANLNTMPWQL